MNNQESVLFNWSKQVKEYQKIQPLYVKYAEVLKEILVKATKKYAPYAIVETRAKTIPSFAEKIIRKKDKYKDPIHEVTDLCGARIITTIKDEVKSLCQFIEKHFIIDWENTIDIKQRHKPTEFGYLSVHYIVQFRPGVFPTKEIEVKIPKELYPSKKNPMKAEIQVRTLLEHAWAVFAHDRSYKCGFKIPDNLQRELAVVAAILEDADNTFDRIHRALCEYQTNYGTVLTKEQINDKIKQLELILKHNPDNVNIAYQVSNLAIICGDWQKVIKLLEPYINTKYPPILRNFGIALCKMYAKTPKHPEYQRGQKYLHMACVSFNDVDTLAAYAGTWKKIDVMKAHELYREAFEIDPSNPYPLGNCLELEIARLKNTSFLPLLKPVIHSAIERCRKQIEVGINLPWAFYDMGKFYLLIGKPYDSIIAYAKAIQVSTEKWMIETSLVSLERLQVIKESIKGLDWVIKLLLIGIAAKFPSKDIIKRIKQLATPNVKPLTPPVVIIAGGCDESIEAQMKGYRNLLIETFRNFQGTIIGGGTTAGISGLVGDVKEKYSQNIKAIGYVPEKIPIHTNIDKRYDEIRKTEGDDFSPLQPLQNWIDIIASGINPSQVKIVGINGGLISAVEYRIAIALGARVAIVEESGREAAKLIKDTDWAPSNLLTYVFPDPKTINAFVIYGNYKMEPENQREQIGKAFHEAYRNARLKEKRIEDESMKPWDELRENLKESNRQEADHIQAKLQMIGCTVKKVKGRKVKLIKFSKREIELMAEAEHARWNIERLADGWKWGPKKDVKNKISPYLVPWDKLPDEIKEYDREAVRKIPEFLAKFGLEVQRENFKNK